MTSGPQVSALRFLKLLFFFFEEQETKNERNPSFNFHLLIRHSASHLRFSPKSPVLSFLDPAFSGTQTLSTETWQHSVEWEAGQLPTYPTSLELHGFCCLSRSFSGTRQEFTVVCPPKCSTLGLSSLS